MTEIKTINPAEEQRPVTARPRIIGVDVARALAVAGMIATHLNAFDEEDTVQGWLAELTSGFPSVTFAVLAGVSLGIIGQRGVERGGEALMRSRASMVMRGVFLAALGVVLAVVQQPISVVLTAVGAIYMILFAAPRWRTRTVVAVWLVCVVISASLYSLSAFIPNPYSATSGAYGLPAWLAYGLFGLLLYRYVVYNTKVQLALFVPVTALAVAGLWWRKNVGGVLDDSFSTKSANYADMSEEEIKQRVLESQKELYMSPTGGRPLLDTLADPSPHSGSFGDLVITSVMAAAVLILCLLLCQIRVIGKILYPLRAMGQMSLTIYTAHVLVGGGYFLDGFEGSMWTDPSETFGGLMSDAGSSSDSTSSSAESSSGGGAMGYEEFSSMYKQTWPVPVFNIVGSMAFAIVWLKFFQRGPLEAGMRKLLRVVTRDDLEPIKR